MSHRPIIRATLRASALALVALVPVPLLAQKGSFPPTNVTVQATGKGVTVAWSASRGVTYRVLRAPDPRSQGVDITRPTEVGSVFDENVTPGTTYFYQVVAVFRDGNSAAAQPVPVTVPAQISTAIPSGATGTLATLQPLGQRQHSRTAPPPTAVIGIKVNGTTASATVTWQEIGEATSYSVSRSSGGGIQTYPGITTPTWTDAGPSGIGFMSAGPYVYTVTALLGGGATVTGQATWTRPAPTCAGPLPNQPMLTVLDPTGPSSYFAQLGRFPSGGVFSWLDRKNTGIVAYRVERSVPGSNAWTLAGTTCAGTITSGGLGGFEHLFVDGLGGIVPNASYQYRVTALAANGEAGAGIVAWTAPSPVVLNLLSATVSGNSVTLKWRYEPPATNAPTQPTSYRVSAPYGLNLSAGNGLSCMSLAGCQLVVNNVPQGTHQFKVTAGWSRTSGTGRAGGPVGPVLATQSVETTVVIP